MQILQHLQNSFFVPDRTAALLYIFVVVAV
jgi:hypothetical protein